MRMVSKLVFKLKMEEYPALIQHDATLKHLALSHVEAIGSVWKTYADIDKFS